jgi:hypothetical protein
MHDTYIDLLNSQSPYSSAYSSPFRLSEHDSYYHRASLDYSQSPQSSSILTQNPSDPKTHLTQNPSDSTNLIPISTIIDELDLIFIEDQSEV